MGVRVGVNVTVVPGVRVAVTLALGVVVRVGVTVDFVPAVRVAVALEPGVAVRATSLATTTARENSDVLPAASVAVADT